MITAISTQSLDSDHMNKTFNVPEIQRVLQLLSLQHSATRFLTFVDVEYVFCPVSVPSELA